MSAVTPESPAPDVQAGALVSAAPAAPAAAPAAATAALPRDPYAEQAPAPGIRFLHHLNPLAKFAAPLPVMLALIFTRGLAIPTAFIVLALGLLLVGARLSGRTLAVLLLGTPVAIAVLGLSFGLWVDPARVEDAGAAASVVLFSVGDWSFTLGAYLVGLATALRIAALLMLSLIAGLTTSGPELVRALVQNLRVPYRIGYTALAALRFVPRFGHELEVIRAAHRVRGTDAGRGPIAAVRRTIGTAIPLLASAIRHAERVALAMDARAFGAHPTRTERTISRWRVRDTVFVVAFWAVSAAVYWWALQAGLGGVTGDRTDVGL
ncbi:energy-coupling factor transport system permease protein [Agromyces sp. CF514]|uniref:energy-coupling factor transporter transmembrane component T family protein n=1 Tax=Agromyces sp. CF514 TaxID=1881031 RepID=UPI0008EB0240|nr:energy-coupling factor transporter transmembrane component T [Agromyces sp. CF514]SFR83005.1 energy-coupling factor transport system permease protein [Agromyces sp. CF514]